MELMKASQQWAERPADQRFWTVEDLHNAVLAHKAAARQATVNLSDVSLAPTADGNLQLVGKTGQSAQLTHWAFSQLSGLIKAPAAYLRTLPVELAATNINTGLCNRSEEISPDMQLLLHENGGYFARAITSTRYTRIWNSEIAERLLGMGASGWKVAPARPANTFETQFATPEYLMQHNLRIATEADAALSLTIKKGDVIGPAGLYASFEDLFAFLVHPERIVKDGSEGGLMRGFMVWNSEVGKSTFGVQTFYFRGVCGNHIIWGASDVREMNLRHVGNADDRAFRGLEIELKKYADDSASDIEQKIAQARTAVLKSASKDDVLDFIFSRRILTRKDAVAAYDAVVEDEDGPAYTAYGFAQGITRYSQTKQNADERVALDRAAGKVLSITF